MHFRLLISIWQCFKDNLSVPLPSVLRNPSTAMSGGKAKSLEWPSSLLPTPRSLLKNKKQARRPAADYCKLSTANSTALAVAIFRYFLGQPSLQPITVTGRFAINGMHLGDQVAGAVGTIVTQTP